jgi:DNA-binding transcriptional ArsR family regulator
VAGLPDPLHLASSTARAAARSGLLRWSVRQLGRAEVLAIEHLKRRLELLEPRQLPRPADAPPEPAQQLDRLLTRAVGQSTSGSRRELYGTLLDQLVPDEARILAALSDGGRAAIVHVLPRRGAPVLENASSVGRAAGVAVPPLVPVYITHLLRLGLVELEDDDGTRGLDYELLMAETTVREALARASNAGVLPPRVVRQMVRLSELGRELWADARPDPDPRA